MARGIQSNKTCAQACIISRSSDMQNDFVIDMKERKEKKKDIDRIETTDASSLETIAKRDIQMHQNSKLKNKIKDKT
jgi:hypothetical protein